ncbi:hypothetical protein GGR21_001186 [Dysgonomonas hofstadii]|uniref:FAR-17a/AIG1-like protein n=1 Tax=Dysgonomonas hofstadii TaxID=637886 RepID=A0A840CH23_9BACT|nr:Pr6Pr family membrane protein [Dysgonomonas hofstadii]MBB4035297.1 hypothetical protein [Dysgonomonas hofstadii]
MSVKNIYRILYILAGTFGILIQLGFFYDRMQLWTLSYYTVLSNILCVVYFSIRLYFNTVQAESGKFVRFIESPLTKYCVTMCIILTFLIYHFLLYPVWGGGPAGINLHKVSNYVVHYIVPVMTIIDFFIFDRNRSYLKSSAPLVWLIIPLTYFVYILLRAPLFGNIGTTTSPYPYPFIDFTIQPISSVMLNIAGIVIVFILIGYLLLGIDSLIVTRNKKDRL